MIIEGEIIMIVVSLTACPIGLRGDLSRWLFEISPGVFVGNVSARVRDNLWKRITALCKDGRATMVYSARNEQHLAFRTFRSDWKTIDCDGLELVLKPKGSENATTFGSLRPGWSSASRWRRAQRFRHL
jgi:CRISPR-associated protein Cas2